jgi:hypothetical protein
MQRASQPRSAERTASPPDVHITPLGFPGIYFLSLFMRRLGARPIFTRAHEKIRPFADVQNQHKVRAHHSLVGKSIFMVAQIYSFFPLIKTNAKDFKALEIYSSTVDSSHLIRHNAVLLSPTFFCFLFEPNQLMQKKTFHFCKTCKFMLHEI